MKLIIRWLITSASLFAAAYLVPGIRVEVSWAGGQDHFFTGLYPEISLGYGDFEMQAGVAYTVRVGEGGEALNNIVAPQCSGDSGVYTGGLEVTFSQ
jgi:hypothetical protein